MMDIRCDNCGLVNRNTSRYCAQCGQALARPADEQTHGAPETSQDRDQSGLDLPWLQAVEDRAAKPLTERLPGDTTSQPAQSPQPTQPSQSPEPTPTPIRGRPARLTQPIEDEPTTSSRQPAANNQPPAHQPPADPNERPPNWVVGILEPQAEAQIGPEQDYEPEELAHIMPWVYSEEREDRLGPGVDAVAAGSLPPWLGDVTVQETLQSTAEADPTLEYAGLGLEGVEPFVPPADASAAPSSPAPEEAPDWLGAITGPGDRATPEPALRRADLSQVQVPEEPARAATPAEGPLLREIPVRSPREGSVEALASLIAPTAPEAARWAVASAESPSLNTQRLARSTPRMVRLLPDGLIYLLTLAALLTVLLLRLPLGDVPAPRAPGVQGFYDTVEGVGSSQVVLVVYDWDASRSAEMMLLAEGITRHLMSRRLQFVTISTTPQGPGFAHLVTDRAQSDFPGYEYGRDYVTLGYLPGGHTGLAALISNYRQILPRDFRDGTFVFTSRSLFGNDRLENLDSYALIITLASDEAELRGWIEQVGTRTDVPMLAAISQGLEPVALPYLRIPGSGLQAVVSGPTGALQYAKLMEQRGLSATGMDTAALTDRLTAQSAAAILVALVIVAALAGMILRRRT